MRRNYGGTRRLNGRSSRQNATRACLSNVEGDCAVYCEDLQRTGRCVARARAMYGMFAQSLDNKSASAASASLLSQRGLICCAALRDGRGYEEVSAARIVLVVGHCVAGHA